MVKLSILLLLDNLGGTRRARQVRRFSALLELPA